MDIQPVAIGCGSTNRPQIFRHPERLRGGYGFLNDRIQMFRSARHDKREEPVGISFKGDHSKISVV